MTNTIFTQATGAVAMPRGNVCSGIQFDGEDCSAEELHMENVKRRILEKLHARLDTPSRSSGVSESARRVLMGIRVS